MSTGWGIQMMTDNCDVISMLQQVQNVTRCTDGDRLRYGCWQHILTQTEQCDQQHRQHFSGWFHERSTNSYCRMNEWINELARNPVRVMASCLTGTAQEDLSRWASYWQADVSLLVRVSFGCNSIMTGFVPDMSTVHQLSPWTCSNTWS